MKAEPLIFIVENEPSYNRLIEIYLNDNGYNNVKCYFSGEDCLKDFALDPDIIILDYNLAGLDTSKLNGLQVLDKINGIFKDPTVIVVSGELHHDVKRLIDAKFQHGMYKYIKKGNTTFKELISALNEITGVSA